MELRLGQSVVLTPHLQYRARFLTHGGRDFADGNAFDAVAQRARLGIGARVSSWMRVMVEVQDIRAWGEELSTTDLSAEGLDIYQGWAELAVAGWFLRAGRQQLTFDGERLVGKLNWADQGRAFDGLRLYTRRGKWRGELFWVNLGEADVYNATRAADGSEVPTQGAERNGHLAGLWKRYEASPAFNASALAFYDRSRNAIRQDRVTLGGRVDGRIRSKLNYRAEGYFQWGRTGPRAARQTILAYLLTARLGYSLALPWRPTVRAFFDYVSGDSDPNRGRVHSFDTLFGTNHKFYGYMDYFLDIPRDTGGFGLLRRRCAGAAGSLPNLQVLGRLSPLSLCPASNVRQRQAEVTRQ